MRIAAFCQLYNELEKGNLLRFLNNVSLWSDELFIYDDASTDGSQDIYRKYTDDKRIIYGERRDFVMELAHKQMLLEVVQGTDPDWIVWMDGDAVMEAKIVFQLREILQRADEQGIDGVAFHNMNLWRSPSYYRVDEHFDGYHPEACWKNNGHLKFKVVPKLHQSQHPQGMRKMVHTDLRILHYGFSSLEGVLRKYLTYKSLGQVGWELNRLIDEKTSFDLKKVPAELYPPGCLPPDHETAVKPEPLTYDEYRGIASWEEYQSTPAR